MFGCTSLGFWDPSTVMPAEPVRFLIIGAGPAGTAAATNAAALGAKVMLVESRVVG
ncbi:MAG TPA: FAD-dependent oxidoreductase, partial [Acidimicrobiia bacterium]|nr:FAD-dependent oxidoreductase [Acidimicrobiia bacterium]